jgi:hypothetical protein
MKIHIVLIVIISITIVASCSKTSWQSIEVQEDTSWHEIIRFNLYTPFERNKLFSDAINSYGAPVMTGTSGDSKSNLTYDEYLGDYGRIRIYNEAADSENGWTFDTWLELNPGELYLEDVIPNQYLKDVQYQQGKWKLSISPPSRSWYFTFELEENAIIKISDMQL